MFVVAFCGLVRLVCGMCFSDVWVAWFLLIRDWFQCCCAAGVSSIACWLCSVILAGLVSSLVHHVHVLCRLSKQGASHLIGCANACPVCTQQHQLASMCAVAEPCYRQHAIVNVLSSTWTLLAVHSCVVVQLY
jgi:hypothetical protein